MATTTNYSWTTPDDTALVKDGAAAIRSLGTAIDTTVFNNASAAIAKTIVDAKGDLIVGTAADTVARLASSASNGNVLTVDTSTASGLKWAAPAGGGKVLQVVYATYATAKTVASTTFTDTDLSATITPTSATSTILIFVNQQGLSARSSTQNGFGLRLLRGATAIYTPDNGVKYGQSFLAVGLTSGSMNNMNLATMASFAYQDSPATTSSTTYKVQGATQNAADSGSTTFQESGSASNMVLMEIGA